MNPPVEEYELSALIDGELDSARAEAIHAALREDPALMALFTRLAAADTRWSAQAGSAQFQPHLLPLSTTAAAAKPAVLSGWLCGLVAALLIVVQFGAKWFALGLGPGVLVHAVMLMAVLGLVVRLVRAEDAAGSFTAAQFSIRS